MGADDPAIEPAPAAPDLHRLRAAAVAFTLALIALGLTWELWLAPTGRGTLAIKVLPLAAALPGLLRHRMYTYRWLSLLLWLYVGEGLVRATSEGGRAVVLAALEVALALALFLTCVRYIRRRLRG
jgi:uncharacterized membrane protein